MLACLGDLLRMVWLVISSFYGAVLPTKSVWISSLFLLIGGGPQISNSIIVTIVSQVTKPVERTKALYLLAAIRNISSLFGPILASFTMDTSVFLPFAVAGLIWVVVIAMILWLPLEEVTSSTPPASEEGSVDNQDEIPRFSYPE